MAITGDHAQVRVFSPPACARRSTCRLLSGSTMHRRIPWAVRHKKPDEWTRPVDAREPLRHGRCKGHVGTVPSLANRPTSKRRKALSVRRFEVTVRLFVRPFGAPNHHAPAAYIAKARFGRALRPRDGGAVTAFATEGEPPIRAFHPRASLRRKWAGRRRGPRWFLRWRRSCGRPAGPPLGRSGVPRGPSAPCS